MAGAVSCFRVFWIISHSLYNEVNESSYLLSEQTVKFLARWFILTLLFHTAKGALRVCSVCLPLLLFLVSPVVTFLVIWNFIFYFFIDVFRSVQCNTWWSADSLLVCNPKKILISGILVYSCTYSMYLS